MINISRYICECEIIKSKEWEGQYECATHRVDYCDSNKYPSEYCPVGETIKDFQDKLLDIQDEFEDLRKLCRELVEYIQSAAPNGSYWQEELAPKVDHLLNEI